MINGVISLASYASFGGGSIGNLFAQWEAAGVFTYMLPFLLIFALVFGLLTKLNIFVSTKGNDKEPMKGVNAIIALAVALMAMQFNIVALFFSEIFPRFGIALSIILVFLILGGLFIDPKNKSFMFGLMAVVLVIVGIVVFNSLEAFGFLGGNFRFMAFLREFSGIIIFIVLIIIVIVSSSKRTPPKESDSLLASLLKS